MDKTAARPSVGAARGRTVLRAALLTALALTVLLALPLALPASAAADQPDTSYDAAVLDGSSVADANRTQLVLVVRFQGDATGDGSTGLNAPPAFAPDALAPANTQWAQVMARLNEARTATYRAPSLYQYVSTVSDGQCRLRTVSPQSDRATGRVTYLTLPKARDAYVNTGVLLDDALTAFNAAYPQFDARALDGDGNGVADNILIVPEVGADSPTTGSPLWPHEADYGGSLRVGQGVKAVKVGTYTLVDSGRLANGTVGTVIHETLHAFGAKDLYRLDSPLESQRDVPVGVWDIMAQHGGSKLMRPLAISRQDCGWTTIEEVTGGTVTLYAPGSGKRQAVKFKAPYSSTEYFVAEFRRANTDTGNLSALDTYQDGSPSTIGGSGLVIYRVNPSQKQTGITSGNKGDKDYVYVFRKGEMGAPRGDGVGDLRHAQLTAPGYKLPSANPLSPTATPATRTKAGSANPDDGLAEGALTYADGTNSGVVVTVTAQTEESITFTIAQPDADKLGLWRDALDASGASPLPTQGFEATKLEAGADGAVYQLCERRNAGGAQVFRYDGTAWKSLGSVGSGYQQFSAQWFNGALYLCGVQYGASSRVALWRWNGSRWETAATLSAAANKPVLGEAAGALYLFADGSGAEAGLYRLSGNALQKVAALSDGYLAGAVIAELDGAPALLVSNFDRQETTLYRLKAGTWAKQRLHDGAPQILDRAVTNNGPVFLTLQQDGGQDSTLRLVAFNNGVPAVTPLPDTLPASFDASLVVEGSKVYVALATQASQQVRVYRSTLDNLGSWDAVGSTVVSPSMDVDLEAFQGALLCASVASAEDPVTLRRFGAFDPSAPSVTPVPPASSGSSGSATGATKPGASGTGSSSSATKPGASGSGSSGTTKPGSSSTAKPSGSSSSSKPTASKKPKRPATPQWRSFKRAKRAVTVRWKKVKKASGYQVKYSTSKKFTKKTTKVKRVARGSATSVKLKSLKSKRTYYVKIRAYQKVGKTYVYSKWTKVKKVRVK